MCSKLHDCSSLLALPEQLVSSVPRRSHSAPRAESHRMADHQADEVMIQHRVAADLRFKRCPERACHASHFAIRAFDCADRPVLSTAILSTKVSILLALVSSINVMRLVSCRFSAPKLLKPLRRLCSCHRRFMKMVNHRSNSGELISMLVCDLSEANWQSMCTIGGSPSAVSKSSWFGSDALLATQWRHLSRNCKCCPSSLVWVPQVFAPLVQSAPPQVTSRPSYLVVDILPFCPAADAVAPGSVSSPLGRLADLAMMTQLSTKVWSQYLRCVERDLDVGLLSFRNRPSSGQCAQCGRNKREFN